MQSQVPIATKNITIDPALDKSARQAVYAQLLTPATQNPFDDPYKNLPPVEIQDFKPVSEPVQPTKTPAIQSTVQPTTQSVKPPEEVAAETLADKHSGIDWGAIGKGAADIGGKALNVGKGLGGFALDVGKNLIGDVDEKGNVTAWNPKIRTSDILGIQAGRAATSNPYSNNSFMGGSLANQARYARGLEDDQAQLAHSARNNAVGSARGITVEIQDGEFKGRNAHASYNPQTGKFEVLKDEQGRPVIAGYAGTDMGNVNVRYGTTMAGLTADSDFHRTGGGLELIEDKNRATETGKITGQTQARRDVVVPEKQQKLERFKDLRELNEQTQSGVPSDIWRGLVEKTGLGLSEQQQNTAHVQEELRKIARDYVTENPTGRYNEKYMQQLEKELASSNRDTRARAIDRIIRDMEDDIRLASGQKPQGGQQPQPLNTQGSMEVDGYTVSW